MNHRNKKISEKRQAQEKRKMVFRTALAILLAAMLVIGTLSPLLAVFGDNGTGTESTGGSESGTGSSESEGNKKGENGQKGTNQKGTHKNTKSQTSTGTKAKGTRANAPDYENLYAVVLEVLPKEEGPTEKKSSPGIQSSRVTQNVRVKITSPGSYQGVEVLAEFERNAYFNEKYLLTELKAGDEVVLHVEKDKYGAISKAYVADVKRQGALLWLVILFFICLLLVGGLKGVKAIFSLLLTGLMIFLVFIPLILKGFNPVILSILVCIVVISISFLIISGWNRKTLAATAGTAVGIVIAGLLFLLFSVLMKISGVANEHAKMLIFSAQQIQIDLKGLLFAGVLIASMGASMDIGMTVSSTVHEVGINSPGISRLSLFKAGLNVGRDAMATMTNTLILAYTGTSLNLILLLSLNSIKPIAYLNWEILAIEITRALTATIGLVSAIPVTAFIAAELFDKKAAR